MVQLQPSVGEDWPNFVTIAIAARDPRRSRRGSTTPPPATFLRARSISISIWVIGFLDAFASLSTGGMNNFRIWDTLIPVIFEGTVEASACGASREGEKMFLAISKA